MFYYLTTFCSSLLCVAYAEKKFKKNRFYSGLVWSFFAILIICLFSGLRANTVGTDVIVYVTPQLFYARQFSSFFSYLFLSGVEPFYSLLIFFFARYTEVSTEILFTSQFLVVVPLYIAIFKKRNEISMTYAMFLYYFLIYHQTLNIMRQSIAGAFLILGLIFLEENKNKKASLCAITAILFHKSAAIVILLYAVLVFVTNGRNSPILKLVVLISTILFVWNIQSLTNILINKLGLFSILYYQRLLVRSSNDISIFEMIMRGVFVIFPLIIIGKNIKYKEFKKYSYMSLIGYIVSFAALTSEYLVRFSYYFYFFFIFTLAVIPYRFEARKINKVIIYSIMSVLVIVYWYVIYIGWGWHGTMPFKFK